MYLYVFAYSRNSVSVEKQVPFMSKNAIYALKCHLGQVTIECIRLIISFAVIIQIIVATD